MSAKKLPKGPSMPAHVASDPYAAGEWNRLGDAMRRAETMSIDDEAALEATASAYSEYRRATEELRAVGRTYTTTGGRVFANPVATLGADAWRRWHAGLSSLGLTPTSRKRTTKARAAYAPNSWQSKYLRNNDGDARDYFGNPDIK